MCWQSFSRFIDLMSFDDFYFCLKCLSSPEEATYRKLLAKELCWWIYPGRFSIGSHRFKPGIGLSTIRFCRWPSGGKAESREISDFLLWESRTFQKSMIVINSCGIGIGICPSFIDGISLQPGLSWEAPLQWAVSDRANCLSLRQWKNHYDCQQDSSRSIC